LSTDPEPVPDGDDRGRAAPHDPWDPRPAAGRASFWLALVLLAVAGSGVLVLAHQSAAIDFYQFWTAARFLNDPRVGDLYAPEARRAVGARVLEEARRDGAGRRFRAAAEANARLYDDLIDPTGTPTFFAFFGPFATGAYESDVDRYQTVVTLAFAAGVLAVCRMLRFSLPASVLTVGVLGTCFYPLFADVLDGNVARLQFGVLAGALWVAWRWPGARARLASGLLLGALVAFKPNVLAVVAMLVVAWAVDAGRRRRELLPRVAGIVLGGVTAGVAGAAFAGRGSAWTSWATVMRRVVDRPYPVADGNYGGAAILREVAGVDVGVALAAALFAAVAGVLWVAARRRRAGREAARGDTDLFPAAAGWVVMLLGGPLAWPHYFVLTVPLILLLARPTADAPTDRDRAWDAVRLAVAAAGLFAMCRSPLRLFAGPAEQTQAVAYAAAVAVMLLVASADHVRTARVRGA
jgi:hypothetical protein